MLPQTKYTRSGDVNIAYQVFGGGKVDLVVIPGWISNIDTFWEEPGFARFLQRLGTFSRVILFDKRGTGLSDRVTDTPMLEERMDDVRAVMDAVGSKRAALLGYSEGGTLCALFAVTYPERTEALIMIGSFARVSWAEDYPFGRPQDAHDQFLDLIREQWGTPIGVDVRVPSLAGDQRFRNWWAKMLRNGASPTTAYALTNMNYEIDVRHLLGSIKVSTLLMHPTGDRTIPVAASRYMAERIPSAKLIEIDSDDHLLFLTRPNEITDAVEEFLTGGRRAVEEDRVVQTVLFTDIVGSTERAAQLGDRRWRDLLDDHNSAVRRELERFRGREVKTAGDGFLATFDGPARAVRCARAISDAVRPLGLETRAGLHTGECEVMGDDIGGIAVHIGARVAARAGAGEVLVSSTVKDLVAGSGLSFQDLGMHALKGVPGEWRLFSAER